MKFMGGYGIRPTMTVSIFHDSEHRYTCTLSRFIEHYEIVQFSGEDIREKKRFG